MKSVAATREPPVVIPVVVVAVDVYVPIVVPAVEGRKCMKYHLIHHPLNTLGVVSYLALLMLQYLTPSIFIF